MQSAVHSHSREFPIEWNHSFFVIENCLKLTSFGTYLFISKKYKMSGNPQKLSKWKKERRFTCESISKCIEALKLASYFCEETILRNKVENLNHSLEKKNIMACFQLRSTIF